MVLPRYNQLLNVRPSQWYFYASHTAVLHKKPSIPLAPNHSLILAYTQLVTNTVHLLCLGNVMESGSHLQQMKVALGLIN